MAKTARYTYLTFANEVKAILEGTLEITPEVVERVSGKADDLIAAQTAKRDYSAANPRKSTSKGASENTKALAEKVSEVLGFGKDSARTSAEINAALETNLSPLQIATAVKFISGASSCKVIREVVNSKGLRNEKEYTAYFKD